MAAPNSAFVGLPTATFAFGPEAAGAIFAQLLVAENLFVIPAALVLADVAAGGGGALRVAIGRALGRMVRNPLLWAVVLAVAARLLDVTPPEPVDRALALVAAVAPGAALLVVGGAMAGQPLSGSVGTALAVAAGKLAVYPLAAFAAMTALGMSGEAIGIALVFAAAPMISVFPLLAGRHAGTALPAIAMVVTTVLSFASVSLVLALAQ
jgi:predicted permease